MSTGQRDDAGRYGQVSRTHHGTKKTAETALAKLVTEVAGGQHDTKIKGGVSVTDVMNAWLAGPIERVGTEDQGREHQDRRAAHNPHIGARPAARVKPAEIEQRYVKLAQSGGVDKAPLGRASIRHVHAHPSAAFRDAVRLKLVDRSPVDRVRPPRTAESRNTTAVTVETIIPAIEKAVEEGQHGLACLVRVAVVTGSRRDELLALRWSDIGLDSGVVVFTRAMSVPGDGTLIEKSTKTERGKTVAIDDGTVAALKTWRVICVESALALGHGLTDHWRVWAATPDGETPWHPDAVSKMWRDLADTCGLQHVRLHDLRHATATTMIAGGIDPAVVASHLGHSNPSVTLSVYSHAVPVRQRAAADLLGDALG